MVLDAQEPIVMNLIDLKCSSTDRDSGGPHITPISILPQNSCFLLYIAGWRFHPFFLVIKPHSCLESWNATLSLSALPVPTLVMAYSEFRPLDEKSLVEYIRATPRLLHLLGEKLDGLTIKEVGDGNLNFVYIVVSSTGSFVVKQVIYLYLFCFPFLSFIWFFMRLIQISVEWSCLGFDQVEWKYE